jgi:hypothetical protein
MAKLKITNTDTSGQIHDRYISTQYINGAYTGGTGGNTSQTGRQLQAVAKIGSGGTAGNSSIIAQKGIRKFRVYNSTDGAGICTLANIATPTAASTMSLRIDLAEGTANIAAANVAGGATQTYVTYAASSNLVGPRDLAVGDWILGFASGNISSTYGARVTAVNASLFGGTVSNVTVAVSGNIGAQTAQTITNTRYAARINNKYAYDFDGNRYRYHLAIPDSTFVRVWYT